MQLKHCSILFNKGLLFKSKPVSMCTHVLHTQGVRSDVTLQVLLLGYSLHYNLEFFLHDCYVVHGVARTEHSNNSVHKNLHKITFSTLNLKILLLKSKFIQMFTTMTNSLFLLGKCILPGPKVYIEQIS